MRKERFTTGNYPRQPVVAYLFVKSLNFSFMLEFNSDVMKDAARLMSHSFATVKVLIKRTFFCLYSFLIFAHGKPRMFHVPLQVDNGIDR